MEMNRRQFTSPNKPIRGPFRRLLLSALMPLIILPARSDGQITDWCKRFDQLKQEEQNFLTELHDGNMNLGSAETIRKLQSCPKMDMNLARTNQPHVSITAHGRPVSLKPMSAFNSIHTLSVHCRERDDESQPPRRARDYFPIAELAALTHQKNLEVLDIRGCGDIGLWPFAELPTLKELYVTESFIGASTPLARSLSHLKILMLDDSVIEDLRSLVHLVGLNTLIIGNRENQGTLVNLVPLLSLYNLSILSINGHPGMSHLEGVQHLSNLDRLIVRGGKVSSILPLEDAAWLQGLDLDDNELDTLRGIERLPRLRWLSVKDNKITDISALAGIRLDTLDLRDNQISDVRPLAHLLDAESFPELNLSGNPVVARAGVSEGDASEVDRRTLRILMQFSQ